MSIWATSWAFEQEIGAAGEKFTLVALCSFADEGGECWPSQQLLAAMTDQDVRTVRRHLEKLEGNRYIERKRYRNDEGQWERYRYKILAPPDKLSPGATGHLVQNPPDTVSDKPSIEPSVKNTPPSDTTYPRSETAEGLSADYFVAGMAEQLFGSVPPLTQARKARYGRELKQLIKEGIEEAVIWEAIDRVVDRWPDHQLAIADAIRDNQKFKAKRREDARHPQSETGEGFYASAPSEEEYLEYFKQHMTEEEYQQFVERERK